MYTLAGTEEVIAIIGDYQSEYRIFDCKAFSFQRMSELHSEASVVGLRVQARVEGYPIRPSNKALMELKEHSEHTSLTIKRGR